MIPNSINMIPMKLTAGLTWGVLFLVFNAMGQTDTVRYEVDGIKIQVNYNRPQARGRVIMGGLVPYGRIWRTGSNDPTSIVVAKDILFGEKIIPAGKYQLYSIPGESEWIIIFQKYTGAWGTEHYDPLKDIARVTAKVDRLSTYVETFTIAFEGKKFMLKWEKTSVELNLRKAS